MCSFSLQSWDIFFRNTNAGAPPGTAYQSPLPLSMGALSAVARAQPLVGTQTNVDKLVEDHLAVQSLIRAYQVRWRPLASRGCAIALHSRQHWACPCLGVQGRRNEKGERSRDSLALGADPLPSLACPGCSASFISIGWQERLVGRETVLGAGSARDQEHCAVPMSAASPQMRKVEMNL